MVAADGLGGEKWGVERGKAVKKVVVVVVVVNR